MAKAPIKKKPGTAVVQWEEEFAKLAEKSVEGVKLGSAKFISFSGGKMSFGGADVPDNELRCVVVGWAHHNAFYDPDIRFDPKNPQSPLCWATAATEEEMEPHEVFDQQSDACVGCPHNEFGTADNGRGAGKACKNGIRLAIISEDDLGDLDSAELVWVSVPTMSIKNWLKYAKVDCAKTLNRPHWAVVTLMKRVADDDSQFRVTFKAEEKVEDSELFGPLKELWENAMGEIDFPYAPTVERTPAKGKGAAKPKGKAAPAGKPSKFARR